MAIPERILPPFKTTYRGYLISLFPYAGGYRSYVFPPGRGLALANSPRLAGADGEQDVLRQEVIRQSIEVIEQDLARSAA